MNAVSLLNELQLAGLIITATSDGELELDAPRGLLTKATLAAVRQNKVEIISLLSRHCPFCGHRGMRRKHNPKEGLLYTDTLCGMCSELIECFVPA